MRRSELANLRQNAPADPTTKGRDRHALSETRRPASTEIRPISHVRKSQRDQLALRFAGTPAHAASDVNWTSTINMDTAG
jgi:hypothetical protein